MTRRRRILNLAPEGGPHVSSARTRAVALTFIAALISPIAFSLVGCGRTTKIYADPAAPATVSITGNLKNPLPAGFFDHSVNQGSVDVAPDGATSTSLALRLQTKAGSAAAGAFNGNGTGNRALLGQGTHDGKKLSDLTSFTFDAKSVSGTAAISISLLVDLRCDGGNSHLLLARGEDLAPGTAQGNAYVRFSAAITDAKWRATGAAIRDPNDAGVILVPSAGAAVSLDALLAKYPDTCLRNGTNADDELPHATPTASVLLGLGSSATTDLNTIFVNRVTIGSDTYEGLEWGSL